MELKIFNTAAELQIWAEANLSKGDVQQIWEADRKWYLFYWV